MFGILIIFEMKKKCRKPITRMMMMETITKKKEKPLADTNPMWLLCYCWLVVVASVKDEIRDQKFFFLTL